MTDRLHRLVTQDTVVFALSGDLDIEHAARLQEFLANEANGRVTLDLKDVTPVGRTAVQFLAGAEVAGFESSTAPEYVRSWIAAERVSQQQMTPQPEEQEPKK